MFSNIGQSWPHATMLARGHAPLRSIVVAAQPLHLQRQRIQPNRRTLWTQSLQVVADGFLDLAIALPYPISFPPYSTTIILTTVITRVLFTLPFSVWVSI